MTTEAAPAAEAAQTREDKFFGVTTKLEDMVVDTPEEQEEIIVEAVEEEEEQQLATPDKPAEVEAGATDKDVENYSAKVQKRIDKLTWEKNEEARQRQAAEAERNEAYRVAKHLHGQSQQQAEIINTGEARLVNEIKSRAAIALEQARSQYTKAYEEGNTEAIAKAQEDVMSAKYEHHAANEYDREYQQRMAQWAQQQQQPRYQPQQPQPQPQQQEAKQPTPESVSWVTRNPWFGKNEHRDMTALAYATHETLIRDEGIEADSKEYYEKLDATMAQRFPEFFTDTSSKPNVVVAPVTHGGAKTRTVRLSPSERSVAKALGLTDIQYAQSTALLKEKKRG